MRVDKCRHPKWLFMALLPVIAAGCQGGPPVEVSEILNHAMCKTLRKGLTVVEYDQLADIRGARMLNAPASEPTPESATGTLLAVSNGSQPTPGYAFELREARADGANLVLDYAWREPPADAVLAQVVTSPCSVVRVVNATNARSVAALLDGAEIGRVELQPSATQ